MFLAGDAVHLVIPTGGLGMNTGVGEATDLAWKLAATLQGWGGPNLLASYQTERQPIGARNVAPRPSRRAAGASGAPPTGRRCARTRRRVWRRARATSEIAETEQRKSNEMIGAELGYRYTGSPLIWPEAGEPPEDDFIRYTPTTFRARAAAARLARRRQRHAGPHRRRLHAAAPRRQQRRRLRRSRARSAIGAPFTTLDILDVAARDLYGRDLILLRPDLHVESGNRPPEEPERLAMATGH